MIVNFWDIETKGKPAAELDAIMPPDIKDPVLPYDLANPVVPAADSFVNKTMEKSVAKYAGVEGKEAEHAKAVKEYFDWRSGKLADFHAEHREKIAKWNADAEEARRKFHDKAALEPLTGTIALIGFRTIYLGEVSAPKKGAKSEPKAEKVNTVLLCAEQIDPELARQFDVICFDSEAKMLAAYWGTLRDWYKHESALMNVGWNSNRFDLRFVRLRSAVHGIKPTVPVLSASGYVVRPLWTDLMEEYANGDRQRFAKINEAARLLGIPTKEKGGGDFGKLWETDKKAALAYLRDDDLRLTEAIGRSFLSVF